MKIVAILALFTLAACGGGIGTPGSIMWKLTANDTERQYHTSGAETTARIQCAQGGYEGSGLEACVRNSMEY